MTEKHINFYIPTYNRSECLRGAILSLVTQPAFNPHTMEVLVCDDLSTDNTQDVVLELQKQYPSIHYICNTKNLGIDGNIYQGFKICTWQYIWIMWDDDMFYPHSIGKVLAAINSYPDAYVFQLNFDHYDKDLTKCTKKNLLQVRETRYFSCLADFYEYGNYNIELISYMGLVFRNDIDDILHTKIPSTYFPQSCIKSLLYKKPMVIVGDSIIQYRTNHSDFVTGQNLKGINNHWRIWIVGYMKFVWFCYTNKVDIDYGKMLKLYVFFIKRFVTLLCVFVVRKLWLYDAILPRWRKSIFNIFW